MKALKRWQVATTVAMSAVLSGIAAAPALAAGEAISGHTLEMAQENVCRRVASPGGIEAYVSPDTGSALATTFAEGEEVTVVQRNIGGDPYGPSRQYTTYHRISLPGINNAGVAYIPASGPTGISTVAECFGGSGSMGSTSGNCRQIDSASQLYLYTSPELSSTTNVRMYQGEQIQVLDYNVAGGGEVWHEVIDSVGNRGYILATDPADGLSTVRNCTFQVTW